MKKLFFFFVMAMLSVIGTSASAQNLLAGWDANGLTGDGSEPNKWGWNCSNPAVIWGVANASGTVRYMDSSSNPASTMPDGTTVFDGRIAMLRWDATYWASVWTLGHNDGSSTTVQPFALKAGIMYKFAGIMEWWSNGTAPTYTFDITTDPTGGDLGAVAETRSFSIPAPQKLFHDFTQEFAVMKDGNYYIVIKQTSGTSKTDGTLLGLANISLKANNTGLKEMKIDGLNIYAANKKIVANFNVVTNSDVEFTVFDAQGKKLAAEKAAYQAGKNQKVLNVSLTSGLYLVKISNNGQIYTQKVIL